MRVAQRALPATIEYDGARLTSHFDGHRIATPIAMIAIGMTDLLFALDSIPPFPLREDTRPAAHTLRFRDIMEK